VDSFVLDGQKLNEARVNVRPNPLADGFGNIERAEAM
jgi:hypothetical protein